MSTAGAENGVPLDTYGETIYFKKTNTSHNSNEKNYDQASYNPIHFHTNHIKNIKTPQMALQTTIPQ